MNRLRFINASVCRYSTSVHNLLNPERSCRLPDLPPDGYTNVTPKLLSHLGKDLHNSPHNPLCLIKNRITHYFYKRFKGKTGNPMFSVYDSLNPVVPVEKNFDSLLIPPDHPSRSKSDCYYINRRNMLRGHMTAHQSEMILSGLDNFIMYGDVYRRDEIDSTHYPVFHQADAVRLCCKDQLCTSSGVDIELFDKGERDTHDKQAEHTIDATKIMENELKTTLVGLAEELFGKGIQYKWVNVYFPFTHPSWELEVKFENKWMEVLGCGIMRHKIVVSNGAEGRIGWAFGLGLERLAMRLYQIPDIRLFWTTDTGFTSQFENKSFSDEIIFKPVSCFPQCSNDLSFWLPDNGIFEPNDFHEIVREVGGELVEQVKLVDEFIHPKSGKKSLCYRITYRHLMKTLTQKEVNNVHNDIISKLTSQLGIKVR